MFNCILFIFYNSVQNNGDDSPENLIGYLILIATGDDCKYALCTIFCRRDGCETGHHVLPEKLGKDILRCVIPVVLVQ